MSQAIPSADDMLVIPTPAMLALRRWLGVKAFHDGHNPYDRRQTPEEFVIEPETGILTIPEEMDELKIDSLER
jgi:hypothetical protein